jgi:hypothetical protein
MNTDSVTFARGDSGRLIDVLVFLAESSAHSLTVRPLSSAPADTAQAIRKAVSEDGYDADSKLKDVLVLHMVFGRVERDIIVAHLSTEVKGSPSSIDYVVEGPVLLGRSYGNYKPDVVFLDYEVRTATSDSVFLVGDTEYLGNWDTNLALPLEFTGAGRGAYHWFIRMPFRQGQKAEFKFLKRTTQWEVGSNRTFTAGDQDVATSDNFREAQ